MNRSKQVIGFIDSGIGGFSILNALAHSLPSTEIIYFADAAHLPYGQKSHAFLLERGKIITQFLKTKGVTTIYVACHTLSSTVLEQLTILFPEITYVDCLPPTITAALAASATKNIGVMATQATITSGTHKRLLKAANPECHVTEQACPLFVDLIEKKAPQEKLVKTITFYVQPLLEAHVDTIILGCTHYWFIQDLLQAQAPAITFISAANALTVPVNNHKAHITIITTASLAYLKQAVDRYFDHLKCCTIALTSKQM